MIKNYNDIINRLIVINTLTAQLQKETIRLMKELEQISVPTPERGKNKNPLSREEINGFLERRLRRIGDKNK